MKNRETFGWYLRNQFKLFLADLVSSPFVVILAIAARYFSRDDKIDFGLGPTPIINLVNHKKALVRAGFRAETFVDTVWHQTTAFDLRFDLLHPNWLSRRFAAHYVFARMIFRYKAVYVYFSGGAFRNQTFLRLLEPALLRLAGVKTVVLAFGADVQELKRTPNFHLVNGMARDYPTHRFIQGKIRRSIWAWTSMADYIVGGCDWVDYLYYWDRLCVSHLRSIPRNGRRQRRTRRNWTIWSFSTRRIIAPSRERRRSSPRSTRCGPKDVKFACGYSRAYRTPR